MSAASDGAIGMRPDSGRNGRADGGAAAPGVGFVLSHVCRSHPDEARQARSGLCKRPVTGPVLLSPTGLELDTVVNRRHHGGPDQALLLMGGDDADHFAALLGVAVPPGQFGENLRIAGLGTDHTTLGDRIRIGEVLLEVSGPRTPCTRFARHVAALTAGNPSAAGNWTQRFTAQRRPGAYLRVLQAGTIEAGMPCVVEPAHGVPVADVLDALFDALASDALLERILAQPVSARLRRTFQDRLDGVSAT